MALELATVPLLAAAAFVLGVAGGVALPIGVDASLLLVALLVLTLAEARATTTDAPAIDAGWTAGMRWLRAHPDLLAVTLRGAAVAMADAAWWSVLVLVSTDRLGLPAGGFGLLLAAGAVGGVLGACWGRGERSTWAPGCRRPGCSRRVPCWPVCPPPESRSQAPRSPSGRCSR